MSELDHHIRNSLAGIEFEVRHIRLNMSRIEKYLKRIDDVVAMQKKRYEDQQNES